MPKPPRKKQLSKEVRGLVTKVIFYRDLRHPQAKPCSLRVDIRGDVVMSDDHAAGIVAVRTPVPLASVSIVRVVDPKDV